MNIESVFCATDYARSFQMIIVARLPRTHFFLDHPIVRFRFEQRDRSSHTQPGKQWVPAAGPTRSAHLLVHGAAKGCNSWPGHRGVIGEGGLQQDGMVLSTPNVHRLCATKENEPESPFTEFQILGPS